MEGQILGETYFFFERGRVDGRESVSVEALEDGSGTSYRMVAKGVWWRLHSFLYLVYLVFRF